METRIEFKVGDSVRVKSTETEFVYASDEEGSIKEYKVHIGGWQGRILKILHAKDGDLFRMRILWDSITLRDMPSEYIDHSGDYAIGELFVWKVKPVKPRDSSQDVAQSLEKMVAKHPRPVEKICLGCFQQLHEEDQFECPSCHGSHFRPMLLEAQSQAQRQSRHEPPPTTESASKATSRGEQDSLPADLTPKKRGVFARLFGKKAESAPATTGIFLFDYSAMDSHYGKQAFDAIYEALRNSQGLCAFHEGDLQAETVRKLAKRANVVKPSQSASPLNDLNVPFDFGAYLVPLWTDTTTNFEKLDRSLVSRRLPGYLGYFTFPGTQDYEAFSDLVHMQLLLPQSIVLKNGEVVKGTSKYGIGFRSVDFALLQAVSYDDLESAKKAIARGADVECIDPNDRVSTPLLHAACTGNATLVRLLLRHGANPNASNLRNTALMLAARYGHLEVVRALVDAGANVNAKDGDGGTALDNAREHPDVEKVLLEAGAARKSDVRQEVAQRR